MTLSYKCGKKLISVDNSVDNSKFLWRTIKKVPKLLKNNKKEIKMVCNKLEVKYKIYCIYM